MNEDLLNVFVRVLGQALAFVSPELRPAVQLHEDSVVIGGRYVATAMPGKGLILIEDASYGTVVDRDEPQFAAKAMVLSLFRDWFGDEIEKRL